MKPTVLRRYVQSTCPLAMFASVQGQRCTYWVAGTGNGFKPTVLRSTALEHSFSGAGVYAHSEHRFPAPSSKFCQIWLRH